MVLQQGQTLPVWGTATPGETVKVTFSGQTATATAGPDGTWRIDLAALSGSKVPESLVVASSETRFEFQDVVVGEVWLCSGQSNMEYEICNPALNKEFTVVNAAQEISAATDPLIRHYKVPKQSSEAPQAEAGGHWEVCSPQTAAHFTAVGYFFARDLRTKLDLPVGLINSSYGGTPIEAWMSAEALAANPAFKPTLERWEKTLAAYPANKVKYDADLAAWKQEKERGANKPAPKEPAGKGHRYTPCGLFNGMIHPLLPYAMRGVLWYQGENNASLPEEYEQLLPALISDWRGHWKEGEFSFYYVQLPGWKGGSGQTNWPLFREAQAKSLSTPHTGMAVTIDLGDPTLIHPPYKQEVGRRLALLAENETYGLNIGETSGPTFLSSEKEGATLVIRFAHAGGLTAKGGAVRGFEISGKDGKFVPAEATLNGDSVTLSSPDAPQPEHVRYAWANWPEGNLYNEANLPASPFRTDLLPAPPPRK